MSLSKTKADINKFSGPKTSNNKPTAIKTYSVPFKPWTSPSELVTKSKQTDETLDVSLKSNSDIEENLYSQTPQKSQIAESNHAANDFSDCDNIRINETQRIMVDLKNKLGADKYKKYSEYMKGKKLSDLIYKKDVTDKNGKVIHKAGDLKPLGDSAKKIMSDSEIKAINETIKNNQSVLSFSATEGKIDLSDEMMNSTIHDVKNTTSGYDAIIFITEKGQPVLVNSSTNPESGEDIAAILLAMSNQVVGPNGAEGFIDILYDSLLEDSLAAGNQDKKITKETLNNLIQSLNKDKSDTIKERIYNGQIKDNQDAIRECIEIAEKNGTKTALSGYSLGGGIQLAAYEDLVKKDKDVKDKIESVSVYNPYIGFAEQNKSINGEDLIEPLGKDKKVTIYSAEQDYISTFNDSLPKLKERMVFVNAKELKEADDSANILQDFIVGSSGNHGFAHIDKKSFDENGNIEKEGHFIPIDASIEDLATEDDKELQDKKFKITDEDFEKNFQSIVKSLFHFKETSKDDEDKGFGDTILDNFKISIEKYLKENIGKYDYDEFCDVLAGGTWNILEDAEDEIAESVKDAIDDTLKSWAENHVQGTSWLPDFVEDGITAVADGLDSAGAWLAKHGTRGIEELLEKSFLDEGNLKKAIKNFLKDDKNKQSVINLIYSSINGNQREYELAVDQLKKNLSHIFDDIPDMGFGNIDAGIVENIALGFLIGSIDDLAYEFSPKKAAEDKKRKEEEQKRKDKPKKDPKKINNNNPEIKKTKDGRVYTQEDGIKNFSDTNKKK